MHDEEHVHACQIVVIENMMHAHDANVIGKSMADHPLVDEVIHSPNAPSPCPDTLHHPKVKPDRCSVVLSKHADDREIKGVQPNLKRGRNKLKNSDLHTVFSHLGKCKGCVICTMAYGTMRKIMRKVNPHREIRPGYVFHMDMITWSHRSVEGNKYSVVIVAHSLSRWRQLLTDPMSGSPWGMRRITLMPPSLCPWPVRGPPLPPWLPGHPP